MCLGANGFDDVPGPCQISPTGRGASNPGGPADLCVLNVPPETALAELDAGLVAATIVGGRLAFGG